MAIVDHNQELTYYWFETKQLETLLYFSCVQIFQGHDEQSTIVLFVSHGPHVWKTFNVSPTTTFSEIVPNWQNLETYSHHYNQQYVDQLTLIPDQATYVIILLSEVNIGNWRTFKRKSCSPLEKQSLSRAHHMTQQSLSSDFLSFIWVSLGN